MELAFPALVSLRVGQGLCHICEAKRRKCDCSCKLKLCRNLLFTLIYSVYTFPNLSLRLSIVYYFLTISEEFLGQGQGSCVGCENMNNCKSKKTQLINLFRALIHILQFRYYSLAHQSIWKQFIVITRELIQLRPLVTSRFRIRPIKLIKAIS